MSFTLNIDDATAAQLEQAARATGVSPSQLITSLVKLFSAAPVAAVTSNEGHPARPSLPPPHDFGNPPDFNYRKALEVLDDEEVAAYRERFSHGL